MNLAGLLGIKLDPLTLRLLHFRPKFAAGVSAACAAERLTSRETCEAISARPTCE